ncbi:MAG: nitrite reductase [Rhodospirillales bacterium]|nr:nitrite reductase [Rhodospirillales bacterium]MCW8861577.1 nitrite reductase [Rhodospirillales bacterium]MCW8951840.1 nitrite reductase [Rhodospirillales bacterium]MCW8971078.1 nitrite reductase [Rhodospirillales bacterium]MCW9001940.1 nitrite reductase [Rhodospirillales bacterium]
MKKLVLAASAIGLAAGLSFGMTAVANAAEPSLSKEDFEEAKTLYFQRCAGCHGVLRKGATGKSLLPEATKKLGQKRLEKIITLGTEGGMNNFDDVFNAEQIKKIATYIQLEPPQPPNLDLAEMKKRWKVLVKPEDYPTKPMHNRNWKNFFVVILRDAGKMAIIDGDKKETFVKVNTGYAVHVTKESSDGRFWFTMGRDGKMTKIDLWMDPPQVVAETQIAFDARDVAVSHYGEWKDKYVIGGGYWPPHFVVLDAKTMEPLKVVSTSGINVDGEYVREARVAAIYNTPKAPTWIVAVKELGQLWQVDYSDLDNLRIEYINSHKFLHDGFYDPTLQYFQIAANASNRMEVMDSVSRKFVASIETGKKPHPGPGANWIDPECGPVGGTVHLGEGKITVWGNDPKGHPDKAWKICYSVPTDGPGLFIRAHPNSPYVFADQTLHPEPAIQQSIKVLDKKTRKIVKTIHVTKVEKAVATHSEFNADGSEVWVSVWARGGKKDWLKGEIVVYDSKTLEEKARIKDLETPTGKFNVTIRSHHIT